MEIDIYFFKNKKQNNLLLKNIELTMYIIIIFSDYKKTIYKISITLHYLYGTTQFKQFFQFWENKSLSHIKSLPTQKS